MTHIKTAERFCLLPANVAPSAMTASNTASKEFRAFYYDARGRVVQLARSNAQGGTDRISTKYKFTGDIEAQRQKVQPASGASTYNLDRAYTYDTRMRLTGVSATLNGGTTASQTVTYDDLQRTRTVTRGNSSSEATSFSYTLQGWLSSAASTSWQEDLFYASPAHTATSGTPGKAGLVTEWKQQQKGTSANGATTAETFAYTYDLAGRLKNSVRYSGTASTSDNKLTEQGISYDRSGNLTALTRRNASGTATQTLSFSYNGPKRTIWTYDNHGNVTADPQGSMTLAWNVLDLPRTLTSGSASTQRSYLADGTLAQVSSGTSYRLYLGDLVFTRTGTTGTPVLESAAWEGGRLISGSGTGNVLYHVTDHLGSVRVIKDGAGTVRQRFDYYPYGSVSRVYTNSSTTDNSVKRYRFGGKEIAGTALTDLAGTGAAPGAPYLDFGARLYSPGTATWLSVDPMAEKYYGIGSLTYCAANPVNLVDPDGRSTWVTIDGEGRYKVEGGEFDDDLNVYFGHYEGKTFIKEYSIGTTAFSTSFYNADSKEWAKGSIIDLQDSSAQSFINNIIETKPAFIPYMKKARNNQVNDFKVSNGIEGRTDFNPYRGMVLGGAIVSARDVGNIAAGYVAGINGIPFFEMRLMFDLYQTYTNTLHYNVNNIERNPIGYYPVIVPSIESVSSRLPQRAGWMAGTYVRIKLP